jgi:hypothetical protein
MNKEENGQGNFRLKLFLRALIPLVMLGCGMRLMITPGSIWCLVIGTPVTVLGTVFLIFTYDEVISKKITPLSEELTRCAVCGRLTPREPGVDVKDTICRKCKEEIKTGMERETGA